MANAIANPGETMDALVEGGTALVSSAKKAISEYASKPVNEIAEDLLVGAFDAALGAAATKGVSALGKAGKAILEVTDDVGDLAGGAGTVTRKELKLASTIKGDAIDPAQFARMKAAFERTGGKVLQGEEVDAYLKYRGVEGVTDNAKQILLSTTPSRSAVFEEFIHTAQHRTGMVDELVTRYGNAEAERLLEINAAEKLIRNRIPYQISNDATRQTIARLRALRSQGGQ